RIRDEVDTCKAVYRLSSIGVIDDYEVDYNTKTLTLSVSKKEDQDYIDELHKYIKRYLSEEQAQKVYSDIGNYRGHTTIQKCAGYLIKFVYKEIAKKREAAIDAMESACRVGLTKSDEEFKEFLDLYFNSKYYLDLVKDTEQGKNFDMELVWKYIDVTEGKIDELKHLRGACARLLTENPDNGGLLLLDAFSLFLIEVNNEVFVNEAIKRLTKGFRIFKEVKELSFEEFEGALHIFKDKITGYNRQLDGTITEISELLLLNQHVEWLKEFNNKFLKDYEYARTDT
ncbi:MAG: hypothetical protein PHU23_14840, partial [Dehalococcoidales bacterium]|nr:hypothetical protein [Dehalococcoidales bacterium]